MLSFKVQQQNLFDQVSERGIPLYGTIPTNGVIFSDTNLTSKGGTLINIGNRMIKAVAAASAGTTNSFAPSSAVSVTSSSSGAHTFSGTNPSSVTQNIAGSGASSDNLFQNSAGAHTHTISNCYNGASDIARLNIGVFSLTGSRFIPSGGWVFGATNPHKLYSDVGGTARYIGGAGTTADINTTTGTASPYTYNLTTSTSSDHQHGISGTTPWGSGAINGRLTTTTLSGGHSHTVQVTGTWTINNRAYINAWKSNSDSAPITRGTIIGWNSTSTSLPLGWFFCDGSTYNGFTTVNFNQGVHLWPQSSGAGLHGSITTGTDTLALSSLVDSSSGTTTYNAGSHTHLPLTRSSAVLTGATASTVTLNHSGWSTGWSHAHTWGTPTSYTGGPSSYGLPLIIYLP